MKLSWKQTLGAAVILVTAASLAGCGDNSNKQDGAPSPQDVGAGHHPTGNGASGTAGGSAPAPAKSQ